MPTSCVCRRPGFLREASGLSCVNAILGELIQAIDDDNCLGMAAELAFYLLLSLCPALLFLVALLSCLPVEGAMIGAELNGVLAAKHPAAPPVA